MKMRLITAGIAAAMACSVAWAGVGVWSGQGPNGGYIYDLLQSPASASTLYVSTRSGIFKSTNSGASWAPMMNGIVGSVSYGYPLAIDADAASTLYAVDSTGHMYRSTDGAANWMQTGYVLAPSPTTGPQVTKVIDAPGSTTRVYISTIANGVLVSNDSGATFTPLNGTGANVLPPGVPLQWLSVDPANVNNLLAGTGYYDGGPGPDVPELYRSTDGGANWTAVLTEGGFGSSFYTPVTEVSYGHGTEVYAIVDQQLYFSPDSGGSWTLQPYVANVTYYMMTVKGDTSAANSVYVGGYFGVKRSTDHGATFTSDVATSANGFTPNGTDVATAQKLSYSGSTWWLASQEAGLFVSSDSGAHWSSSNAGIDATNIRALGMVPVTASHPRILAGYGDAFRPSPGMYAGTDAGDGNVTWANSNNGLRAYQIRAITVDPTTASGAPGTTTVYAGGRSEQVPSIAPRNGGVYKSTDGGTSWTTIDSGLPLRTPVSSPAPFVGTVRSIMLDPHSCAGYPTCTSALQTVYATSNGCYKYLSRISGTGTDLTGYCGSPQNTQYTGAYQFRIFKSINGGTGWSTSDTGIPQSFIGNAPNYSDYETLLVVPLVIDPSNPNILYAGTSDQFDATQVVTPTLVTGVYKSTDGGATWNPVNTGLPKYPGSANTVLGVLTLAIDPINTSTLWASVIDINAAFGAPGHIYKTVDGGAHWTETSSGLTSADIRALLVDHPSGASPAIVYAAGGGTSGNPGGVFKSYDAGATWHSESIGLPADAALALGLDPTDHTKLYAGTSSGVWEITQTTDTDMDGVSDIQEDLGPNGGDSNLDTIADRLQPDVTYVPPHTSARPASPSAPPSNNDFAVQVTPQAGGTCAQTQDVQAKSAAANGPDPIAKNLNYRYDVDLAQFEILNCASTTVKITYPNFTFGAGWTFRFFGPATPGDDASIKYYDFSSKATKLDAHTWQLTLTRGQFGSYRPASTGSILFQGAPAYSDRIFGNGLE
jgi:photosystem II stability/assembly factor-like uncharacterized protein